MVVDAVSVLDPSTLDLRMIGTKKVQGGGLRDSFLVDGVAFKKTFSYAGFEMQPKSYKTPKILLLNIELELKSEKENAEVNVQTRCCLLHESAHVTLLIQSRFDSCNLASCVLMLPLQMLSPCAHGMQLCSLTCLCMVLLCLVLLVQCI